MNTTYLSRRCLVALAIGLPLLTGCAAFHPIHGVPARYLPDEFRGPSRSNKETIDLSLLRQRPVPTHIVDANDLLSIYIEGVLGRRDDPPPVHFPLNTDIPPTVGYPIPVRDDGTISLPLVGALPVRGLTIRQVEERIRKAYTVDHQFLQPERDRIFVALQQPRTFRILVIRQEASSDVSIGAQGQLNIGALKRGTGQVVNLPVYKNDVLNALAQTGGLPGLDAENAIYIIRGQQNPANAYPVIPNMPPQQAHRSDFILRGQSPDRYGPPQGDYRSQVAQAPVAPMNPYASPRGMAPVAAPPLPQAPIPAPPLPQLSPTPLPPAPGSAQPSSPYVTPMPPVPAPVTNPYVSPYPAPALPPIPEAQPYAPPLPPPPANWSAPPATGDMLPPTSGGWSAPDAIGGFPVQIDETLNQRHIVRIPIRLSPGEPVNIREQDIILCDGDIVFIESRETEVFYTGGLLGGGQYTLPRDYDLDVLGAIAIAQGGQSGGGGASRATQSQGGQSALNADVSISASQLIILRPLPDGNQVTVQIDLYEAVRNPNERIIVQPGDYLILQYTRAEAVMAFIERHLLEGALFGVAAAQLNSGGN